MNNPASDQTLQNVILGGLLHDIGKLLQRATQVNYLDHSKIGAEFILRQNIELPGKKEIVECIKYHHWKHLNKSGLPEDSIAHIVYEADNISSGMDRRKMEKEIEEKPARFDRETVLSSIFDNIQTKKGNTGTRHGYYLRDLNVVQPINYPVSLENNIKAIKAEYQKKTVDVESNFTRQWNRITKGSANSILQILESTCSYIPSSTNTGEIPDISLFDHLKLTSAIAACMYLHIRDEKKSGNFREWCSSKNRDENFFLLVSADISGIQDFIYTVASKGAMKSLRTRSFYLDLMLEHIADEILEALDLSRANLLYTGGGHFYMLLPNTPHAEEILEQAKEKINGWFLSRFKTSLYLAMSSVKCSSSQLMAKDGKGEVPGIFRQLTRRLSLEKLRRYSHYQLKEILTLEEGTRKDVDPSRECSSCRSTGSKLIEKPDEDGETALLCDLCDNFIKCSKLLIKPGYTFPISEKKPGSFCLEMPSIDESPRFLIPTYIGEVEENPGTYRRIYFKNKWMSGLGVSANLWMGDYVSKKETDDKGDLSYDLLSFEDLENRAEGIKRIAVLRADVDSLGMVFSGGFKPKVHSLSRYTTLSRQLSLFFKHYINKICKGDLKGEGGVNPKNFQLIPDSERADNKDGRNISVVYSGGDDVFVVGAWNDVLEFAMDLRKAFGEFTCDKLTFSAGIGFFNHSFPVYQMAKLTGELEDRAKKRFGDSKNAVALFGFDRSIRERKNHNIENDSHEPEYNNSFIVEHQHIYTWDDFEKGVYPKVQFFLEHFSIVDTENYKLNISKAFLYRLLILLEPGGKEESINLARLAYTLARLEKSTDKLEEKERFTLLKNTIYQWASEDRERKMLNTAINLLIYMFREKKGE